MSAEVGSSAGSHPKEAGAEAATAADAGEHARALTEIGPYRIMGVLGDGGMGTVYEGLQPDIERWVAIKVLHAELAVRKDAQARLQQEARVTNRVAHPGLVQISEVGRLPTGQLYLVMDLLRGETIAARLFRNEGMLPLGDTVNLGIQLAEILSAAHQRGVVHRDLKPSNLMMVCDPQMPCGERLKLIDFGIAKVLNPASGSSHKTPPDSVLGTPDYMSPEQCAGDTTVDHRSDVYSFGAVLFHLLAGRPPFFDKAAGRVLAMHQYETPPWLSDLRKDVPIRLSQLVAAMLAKPPGQRPGLQEVVDSLRDIAEELGRLPDHRLAARVQRVGMGMASALREKNPLANVGPPTTQAPVQAERVDLRRVWVLRTVGFALLGTLLVGALGVYAVLAGSPTLRPTSQDNRVAGERPFPRNDASRIEQQGTVGFREQSGNPPARNAVPPQSSTETRGHSEADSAAHDADRAAMARPLQTSESLLLRPRRKPPAPARTGSQPTEPRTQKLQLLNPNDPESPILPY